MRYVQDQVGAKEHALGFFLDIPYVSLDFISPTANWANTDVQHQSLLHGSNKIISTTEVQRVLLFPKAGERKTRLVLC